MTFRPISAPVAAASNGSHGGVMPVSPRARRVAAELGVDLDIVVSALARVGASASRTCARRLRRCRRHRPEPRATPSVRKLAEEIGVDLRTVPSSRPSGRITRADLTRGAVTTVSGEEGTTVPDQLRFGAASATG